MTKDPKHRVDSSSTIGKGMMIAAWVMGILLLTMFFGKWENEQLNPNAMPESMEARGIVTTRLKRNRYGHYVANGTINGKEVTFMVDTGATDVVIPKALASKLNLPNLSRGTAITANGVVEVINTRISRLTLGKIVFNNVEAALNPGMERGDEILLGMSALRHVDFRQENDELVLTLDTGRR